MRILIAALVFLSPASAFAGACQQTEESSLEVCKSYDGGSIEITYRGSLVQAAHAVIAKGNINGLEFSQQLQAMEPMQGEKIAAFAEVSAQQVGPLDVTLYIVNDAGEAENAGKPSYFHFE